MLVMPSAAGQGQGFLDLGQPLPKRGVVDAWRRGPGLRDAIERIRVAQPRSEGFDALGFGLGFAMCTSMPPAHGSKYAFLCPRFRAGLCGCVGDEVQSGYGRLNGCPEQASGLRKCWWRRSRGWSGRRCRSIRRSGPASPGSPGDVRGVPGQPQRGRTGEPGTVMTVPGVTDFGAEVERGQCKCPVGLPPCVVPDHQRIAVGQRGVPAPPPRADDQPGSGSTMSAPFCEK